MLKYLFIFTFALPFFGSVNSQDDEAKIKVAILPFYSSDANSVNDVFYRVFETELTTVVDSVEFTQNIFGNVPFNEWIFDLEAKSLEKKFAQSNPSIYEGLSKDRIKLWRLLLMNADYLLISSPIGFEEQKGKKGKKLLTIYGMYTLFDLKRGTIVIQCEENVQIESASKEEDITPLIHQYYKCFENSVF